MTIFLIHYLEKFNVVEVDFLTNTTGNAEHQLQKFGIFRHRDHKLHGFRFIALTVEKVLFIQVIGKTVIERFALTDKISFPFDAE